MWSQVIQILIAIAILNLLYISILQKMKLNQTELFLMYSLLAVADLGLYLITLQSVITDRGLPTPLMRALLQLMSMNGSIQMLTLGL